jgi:hypothetical protein
LAFKAAVTVTGFKLPTTWVNPSDAADKVTLVTLAKADVDVATLELVVEFVELDVLASPQATKVSVKTEVVTNLKIFFILKNHLLRTLYTKQFINKIVFCMFFTQKVILLSNI